MANDLLNPGAPTRKDLERTDTVLTDRLGLDVTVVRPEIRAAALIARASLLGQRVVGYVDQLGTQRAELERLADLMLGREEETPLTPRDLERVVASLAVDAESLRIWVVGCGDAPIVWQLAALILSEHDINPERLTVFATDIDDGVLKLASKGRLRGDAVRLLPTGTARFFSRDGDDWKVGSLLRGRVAFARHDLIRTPPFGRLDLVLCRSLLPVLTADAKQLAVERMAFALRSEGLLLVDPVAGLPSPSGIFDPIDRTLGLYRRGPKAQPVPLGPRRAAASKDPTRASQHFQRIIEAMVDRPEEAVLLVRPDGRLERILRSGPGVVELRRPWDSQPLGMRVDPSLENVVLDLVRSAGQLESRVHRPGVARSDGHPVDVSATPVSGEAELFLVRIVPVPKREEESPAVIELRRELGRVRSELEEAVSALEVGNRELAEHVKELGTANERLSEARQELLSRNHELEVTQEQLRHRLADLEAVGTEAEQLFEGAGVAAVFLSPAREVLRFSRAFEAMVGTEPHIGCQLPSSWLGREVDEAIERVLDGDPEVELERSVGGRYLLVRVRPRTRGDMRDGLVLTLTDLSSVREEKRAEEVRTRQLADLFETSDDPTLECLGTGAITFANRAARELLHLGDGDGFDLLESFAALGSPDLSGLHDTLQAALHGARRARVGMTLPHVGAVYDVTARPIYVNGTIDRVVVTARDVTELDASQREVRSSRHMLQAVLDSLPAAISVVDDEGVVLLVNAAWRRSGLQRFPGGSAGVGTSLLRILDEEAQEGREESALVHGHISRVLARETEVEPCRYWLSQEPKGRTFLSSAATPFDHDGRSLTVVVQDDETSIKLAETLRLDIKAKAMHAAKLESLGVLASGVAHDFNNLLVSILSNASLVLDQAEDPSDRECLQDIEHAAERAAGLCQQLLAFSGKGQFHLERVNLESLVRDSARLLRTSIDRSLRLNVHATGDTPRVSGDLGQLRQVFFNLVTNAAEAHGGEGGRIDVTVVSARLGAERIARGRYGETASPGEYVGIQVRDEGGGIPSRILDRIFDPFFSTKFTGRGLGLAAVQGIMVGHRGLLEVETEPGCGTAITAWFPTSSTRSDARPSVLIVDDEDIVRGAASRALSRGGFRVLEASTGDAALRLVRADPGTISLVLLDVAMPGQSGEVVYLHLRQLLPSVPVIFTSGLPELGDSSLLSPEENTHFIQKPYRPTQLLELIRRLRA